MGIGESINPVSSIQRLPTLSLRVEHVFYADTISSTYAESHTGNEHSPIYSPLWGFGAFHIHLNHILSKYMTWTCRFTESAGDCGKYFKVLSRIKNPKPSQSPFAQLYIWIIWILFECSSLSDCVVLHSTVVFSNTLELLLINHLGSFKLPDMELSS